LPQNSILKTSDLQRVEIDTMSILFFHFLQCGNLLQMLKHFQKQEANNNFMTELKELSTNNQLNGSMAKFNEQKEKRKGNKKHS
jgi:Cft2 family RNA processing exonuclease